MAVLLFLQTTTQVESLNNLHSSIVWDARLARSKIQISGACLLVFLKHRCNSLDIVKAITYRRYGGPEVLEYVDVPSPTVRAGQVLVKAHSASINAADYRLMRADPWLARLASGLFRPKKWPILGSDFSGTVEGVGPGVNRFKVGDAVFGDAFSDGRGTFAEYVCVSEASLALKPDNVTFEEASAVPLAAITALQGLRDLGQVGPNQSVLIQGTGGGVGTFALQIAKNMGANVTAVCGPRSVDLARRFGADRVIDYSKIDFSTEYVKYDVIVAINGYKRLTVYKECLNPGGRYVMIGGENRQIFETLLLAPIVFRGSGKTARALTVNDSLSATDLEILRTLLIQGKIAPVIDRTFPLVNAAEAMRYVESGHVHGKVVLTLSQI